MKTTLGPAVAACGLALANLSGSTLHVSPESRNPIPPYATWATAAANIQDAVDTAKTGDTVLVTNGVYTLTRQKVGTGMPGSIVVTNALTLRSVNGSALTTLEGYQLLDQFGRATNGVRCIVLEADGLLEGFTLTRGYADYGGGVWCASSNTVLANCVISGNSAQFYGGGVLGGTLNNCTLASNSAGYWGGGASGAWLRDCTVTANQAAWGGGAYGCALLNCGLTRNSASGGGGGASESLLDNCTLTANRAFGLGSAGGGGAHHCILNRCLLTGNWVETLGVCFGGGAYLCTLKNCALTGNSANGLIASRGGASYSCTLYNSTLTGNFGGADGAFYNCTVVENEGGISGEAFNSIVYYNSGGNFAKGTDLNSCCTTPVPYYGANIGGPPLFVNMASGELQLREDSPCIDAGMNLVGMSIVPSVNPETGETIHVPYTCEPTDILGNTRFIDGNGDGVAAWDIGAYEFNSFKPPRFLSAPQLTSEGWRLDIVGAPNKWVHVQRSNNLMDWENVGFWPVFMGAEGVQQVTDADTGRMAMFYRALVP